MYSKTELNNEEIIQTSCHDVNTNNDSSGLRENAMLTNFGAKSLVENIVPNYAKGVGRYKRDTPEIDILTMGEEIVPIWMWVWKLGGGMHSHRTYLPTEDYAYLWPPLVEEVVQVW